MTSERPLIVVPGDDPVQIGDSPRLDPLRSVAELRVFHDRPADVAEQVRRASGADVLINSRSQLKWNAETLAALPKLRMIAVCGIGTDAIDLAAARERNIVVCNVPGKTAAIVAEHVIALLFAVAKRTSFQTAELRGGRWTRKLNVTLAGKTLGVIGTGAIGSRVVAVAKALGMNVVAWTFRPTAERATELGAPFLELDELLQVSDAVSLHVRLSPETRGLIGARELSLMKPGAMLINTARGPVVDTDALVESLNSGRLTGAGLDVFDQEPLPPDHPILSCEQVVLTPHNADQTPEGIDLVNQGAVDAVLAFLAGSPRNMVT
ncbi:MAG: hydroxyacid dehydrogenase [Planctomycetales bacterium]